MEIPALYTGWDSFVIPVYDLKGRRTELDARRHLPGDPNRHKIIFIDLLDATDGRARSAICSGEAALNDKFLSLKLKRRLKI